MEEKVMKDCKVLALCSQKGGVGKTTSCVNLAVGLAKAGKKVLVIDNDPQGSMTASLGYHNPDELPITLDTILTKIVEDEPFENTLDCNVSKLFEERLHKALALPEFAGRFNLIRHNLYTDTGRQEARSAGISDAPTAYCNGDILRGVQSDYTIRKYLRKLLG